MNGYQRYRVASWPMPVSFSFNRILSATYSGVIKDIYTFLIKIKDFVIKQFLFNVWILFICSFVVPPTPTHIASFYPFSMQFVYGSTLIDIYHRLLFHDNTCPAPVLLLPYNILFPFLSFWNFFLFLILF